MLENLMTGRGEINLQWRNPRKICNNFFLQKMKVYNKKKMNQLIKE